MTEALSMSPPSGPWLNAALLCEQILQERDGTLSAIRIVDRLTIHAEGQAVPVEMPRHRASLKMLLVLRSGSAKGKATYEIVVEDPRGFKHPTQLRDDLFLPGEEAGAQVIIDLNLDVDYEGVYWFDVSVDGRLFTRVPLRVMYRRVSASHSGSSE
ncbi:MAG: hypothetical protein KatS3mg060_1890 [Dehalococcoidia bacterium]|nr:MAG: hypothetical protein KatS3mg060_1890 [Dehalococcoidia bacterium]